jgi:hypothetical protein
MAEDISHPIRKAPKKYPALLNYESHQNQETFAYQIKNQIQFILRDYIIQFFT